MQKIQLLTTQIKKERQAHKQVKDILEERIVALNASNELLVRLNGNLNNQLKEGFSKLNYNEKGYQELIESVQDIMYKISPEGYLTFVNNFTQQRLDFTEEELIGRHFMDFVLPEYKEYLASFFKKVMDERIESTYLELPIRAKNGNIIWIGQTSRLIKNDNLIIELVVVARDISDRKIAEDLLRTTQSRLTSLITNLQKGVLVEDENRKIVIVNQLLCNIFNVSESPDSLVGMDLSQSAEKNKYLFKDPENFTLKNNCILDKKRIVVDEKLEMADGRILLRTYIPIFLENQYRGHLWEYSDITQQHTSRELIRKSEEKYRGIMNNVELGLLEVDNDQVIVRTYDSFCKMVGYTQEELIGRNAQTLFLSEEFEKKIGLQQNERSKGNSSSYELQLRKKDGGLIWVIISGVPILGENGEVVGSMGIHYDINERKQLEQQLEKANQMADDARQSEKQFLANMSHEIRTPLNAIIGMTHLLFDTGPSTQQYEYLDILNTSADFLLNLISNLLDMSKIEAGKFEVQNHPFDLVGLLKTTQKLFQIKLENRPIEISLIIDERISGNYIGDRLILNQILLNIIGNAEKFTEKGSINITVKQQQQQNGFDWIEFKIQDSGSGIAIEHMNTIFHKFKQINTHEHKHKGTGLGLSITKQLIEIQAGTISVSSEQGLGSTFLFVLPYRKSENEFLSTTHNIQTAPKNLKGCHILVVEDNTMNQKYITSLLNKWEIRYVVASDGRKAVEQAQNQTFDIILMDIQMPIMDGYEAAFTIRNTKNLNQQTPIIALTASAMPEQKIKAMETGMNDFVTKPFAPNNLLSILHSYINS